MKKFFLFIMLLCGTVYGQGDVHPEAVNEINRRGNYVELVDGINQAPNIISDMMQPPADTDHKWFISVVTTNGCSACDRLKYDFANTKELKAWANLQDPKKSFTHFNVYRYEDETQKWRFENVRFRGFPTLLIQPPLNRKYGDPSTIVAQVTGYDGNAKKLSDTIRNKMIQYVNTIQRRSDITGFNQTEGVIGQRRPMPDFLPQDEIPLIPPELENPLVPDLIPSTGGVLDGIKQVFSGLITIFSGSVGSGILHTILLITVVVLLVLLMKKLGVSSEKKDENKNVQS